MKPKTVFTRADIIVTLVCVIFLLLNLAAVGPGGQRHAKQMLCLSQLHKWGEVFQDYLNDNGGYFMKGWTYDAPYGGSDMWMSALRDYYGNNDKLRCCPEATVPGSEIGGFEFGGNGVFTAWGVFSGNWPLVIPGDYGSYGMNSWACNPPLGGFWGPPFNYHNWRVAHVAGADNIPLFLDSQWFEGWPLHTNEPPAYDGQFGDSIYQHMGRFCMNRHRGYINSLFLDFSARKVGLKELWTLKWHRRYDTCGVWTVCGGMVPNDWPEWMRDFEDY